MNKFIVALLISLISVSANAKDIAWEDFRVIVNGETLTLDEAGFDELDLVKSLKITIANKDAEIAELQKQLKKASLEPVVTIELKPKDFVKLSKTNICHAPGTTYYKRTKNYSKHDNIEDCIAAGGRLPKKAVNKAVKKEWIVPPNSDVNIVNVMIRCNMYVNAMVFGNNRDKIQNLIISELRGMGVGRDQEVQIRTRMRKIIKQSGVTFSEQMDFLSKDCKTLGLIR